MLLPVFAAMVKDVWDAMRDGGKSIALKKQLLHFNGGLFDKAGALSVNQGQLVLLIEQFPQRRIAIQHQRSLIRS